MGATNRLDSLDCRLVVEQDAASAIDLEVDEPGHESTFKELRRHAGGAIRQWQQLDDAPILDQDAVFRFETARGEEAGRAQRQHLAGLRDLP
jgi:hypothetical protein